MRTELRRVFFGCFCCLLILTPFLKSPSVCADDATPAKRGAEVVPERFYRRIQVLCVGIDKYRFSGIKPLAFAEADAQAMADLFRQKYGYDVEVLLRSKATKAALLEKLKHYEEQLGAEDALIVFFAGHGQTVELESQGRAGFLLCFDSNLELDDTRSVADWREQALEMHELGKIAQRMKARHVLFLADACYSGFLGRRAGNGERKDLTALARLPSRVVMTAGTEEQHALEYNDLKHGVFTHQLLKHLNVEVGQSATELFAAVRRGVANHTNNLMLPQYREITIENGEFVFLPRSVAGSDVASEITEMNRRINQRSSKRTTMVDLFKAYDALSYGSSAFAPEKTREWEGRLKRFEDNAALGEPLAMAGLYYCYAKGLGTKQNSQLAMQWARRGDDSGDPTGRHVLAEAYAQGQGVPKNQPAADRLYVEAAKRGAPLAQFLVASHVDWESVSKDERREAVAQLAVTADAGLGSAQWLLARVLLDPKSPATVDAPRAVKLLRQAAESELPRAMFDLYRFSAQGIPGALPKSSDEGLKWLTQAAQHGDLQAQVTLAAEYYQRHGNTGRLALKPNLKEAFKWAKIAGDQQHRDALKMLAWMYGLGEGVEKDPVRAIKLRDQVMEAGRVEDAQWAIEWTTTVVLGDSPDDE